MLSKFFGGIFMPKPAEDLKNLDIHALGRYIKEHIDLTWQTLLETRHDHFKKVFEEIGDEAYGAYLEFLFRPIFQAFKTAGLEAVPKLPGEFEISREWGSTTEQTDQQRWMWSTVQKATGEAIGTLVVIVYHDHTMFRIGRQPEILSLNEVGKEAVVKALSERSSTFAAAQEASVEIAAYLESLGAQ
jgi:Family of unknown function (DUF6022)